MLRGKIDQATQEAKTTGGYCLVYLLEAAVVLGTIIGGLYALNGG